MTTMWKEFEAHQRRANAICRAEQDYKGHPLIDFLCDDLLDNPSEDSVQCPPVIKQAAVLIALPHKVGAAASFL